jgi:S-adenosylmethionine hydrolase
MGEGMTGLDILTFLSDFGWEGGYVASCEAIVARLQPRARILHISHEVALGDIAAGALILSRVAPLCPAAVHLAVIDPGVGTGRHPLALVTARGDVMVGPDNGLLPPAAEALGGFVGAWILDPGRVRARAGLSGERASSTFHGRDVFAPAAALLSMAVDPSQCGAPMDPAALVRLPPPACQLSSAEASAEVIDIDRFGNVGLALPFEDLFPNEGALTVVIEGEDLPAWRARVVQTYGELRPGELGVFRDSWGQVALAFNTASAAQLLSVERGMMIRLAPPVAGSLHSRIPPGAPA